MIDLKDQELGEALCSALEPDLPLITARQARENEPGFTWVSCHDYDSPKGWHTAEIGTDHGSEKEDDDFVHWRHLLEITSYILEAWKVVDEMKDRGWLFSLISCVDGWIVNARRYDLSRGGWKQTDTLYLTGDMVQEIGDTVEEAICRAALAALRTKNTVRAESVRGTGKAQELIDLVGSDRQELAIG